MSEDYDDDDPPLCGHCKGSGEGMYDGSRCGYCGGSGVEQALNDAREFDECITR